MELPIVLLPGTLCDEKVWDQVTTALGSSHKVITKPLGAYPNWHQELEHLLQGLPPQFVLAGFSLGGIAALSILSQYPERVTQLVLVASTALADPEPSQARRRALLQQAKNSRDMTELAMMQLSACDRTNLGTEGVQIAVDMANRMSVQQYACQTELACTRLDTRTVLSKSEIPIHLVFGSEDQACGEDKQTLITEVCSHAKTYQVIGAGHWLPLSHPELLAQIISSVVKG